MRVWVLFISLTLLLSSAAAQSVTDAEARILSAFTARTDPSVLAEDVKLGPALQKELAGATDRGRIYAALSRQIAGNPVRVSALSPVEAALHAPLVGGNVSEPLVRLEAGGLELVMQYSPSKKQVAFVEQLRAPAPQAAPAPPPPAPSPAESEAAQLPPEPPKPAPVVGVPLPAAPPPPLVEKPAPAPVTAVPKPAAPKMVEKPKPPSIALPAPAPKPRGECVIKPVMSEEDLWNCSGPATPAALQRSPGETKIQPSAAPAFRTAPADCEIKPVMTDEELRACGARR